MSGIRLSHFFGIEVADFAAETAKLSLWIAEYQMNENFKAMFGSAPPALPLKDSGNIVQGNATRLDWSKICPKIDGSEVYVVGNPPYLGRAEQTPAQKEDIANVFAGENSKFKSLDYVSCWLVKGARFCSKENSACSFVATNSICQGEQVALLWPLIYKQGVEIAFAHQSFKWKNNASNNAGVTCVIIGLRKKNNSPKILYEGNLARAVKNIGPYLTESPDVFVTKRSTSLCDLPKMDFGSMANDEGHLILSAVEKQKLVDEFPEAKPLVRRLFGSQELIKGVERWCLWISDQDFALALSIPAIAERIEAVRLYRAASRREETRALANTPHQFGEIRHKDSDAFIVPKVSSEQRLYIPIGLISAGDIVTDLAFAVYNPPVYLFSILSSRLHLIWTAAVGGQLETRLRYSNTLVYNNFPLPDLSTNQKSTLEVHTTNILNAREAHPGKTIAWLYDSATMPADLLYAHQALDDTLERIYIGRPFRKDTERLEHLFKRYAAMIKKVDLSAEEKVLV